MMGKTKKIVGIFLSLVLVLGMVPLFGFTSKADDNYVIRIGDNEGVKDIYGEAYGSGWLYTPGDTNVKPTLTLTNANISGEYGIFSDGIGSINIVLVGNNTITSTTNEGINIDDDDGFLTISGEGTLTVNGSTNGIKANNVTLDSGAVTVNANANEGIYAYGPVVVNGGSLNVTSVSSGYTAIGVKAIGGLKINDGNFNAKGNSSGVDVGSNSVTINGGTVVAGSSECKSGITSENLYVNSGTKSFVAVGKEKALDCNYIMNEIPGVGWTNTEGTEGEAYIAINKDPEHSETDLESYKKLQFPQQPEVIDGANQTVSAGSSATFRINKDFGLFQNGGSVKVDGKEIEKKYYEAKSGSTIITLNGEFTKNLSEGEHVLAVKFGDNTEANTTFTITKEAQGSEPSADSGEATSPTNTDNSSANNTTANDTTANNSSTSDAKGKAPKTSDTLPIGAVALIIIGIGTIGVVVYRRRRL